MRCTTLCMVYRTTIAEGLSAYAARHRLRQGFRALSQLHLKGSRSSSQLQLIRERCSVLNAFKICCARRATPNLACRGKAHRALDILRAIRSLCPCSPMRLSSSSSRSASTLLTLHVQHWSSVLQRSMPRTVPTPAMRASLDDLRALHAGPD